jgi:hypothetical protein
MALTLKRINAPKRRAHQLAKELGAEISETDAALHADAPEGRCFAANRCGSLTSPYVPGEKPAAWEDLAERLALGLE